jgi:hypothetical protein
MRIIFRSAMIQTVTPSRYGSKIAGAAGESTPIAFIDSVGRKAGPSGREMTKKTIAASV